MRELKLFKVVKIHKRASENALHPADLILEKLVYIYIFFFSIADSVDPSGVEKFEIDFIWMRLWYRTHTTLSDIFHDQSFHPHILHCSNIFRISGKQWPIFILYKLFKFSLQMFIMVWSQK